MNLNKRTLILIGSVLAVLLIIVVVIALTNSKPAQTSDKPGYKDPGSGEIIKNDKNPNGEDGNAKDTMIFPGFSVLLDRGLSPQQVQSIESALRTYSKNKNKQFKEVSLQTDSLRHILPKGNSRTQNLNFNIVVNRSDSYYISTSYQDTTTILTVLFAPDKTTELYRQ